MYVLNQKFLFFWSFSLDKNVRLFGTLKKITFLSIFSEAKSKPGAMKSEIYLLFLRNLLFPLTGGILELFIVLLDGSCAGARRAEHR